MPNRKKAVNRATLPVTIAVLILLIVLVPLTQSHSHQTLKPRSPIQSSPGPSGVYFDHLVVIMLENEGVYDICGFNLPVCNGNNSPYMATLANGYALSEQYLSIGHPSQPNYIGFLGAFSQNCTLRCAAGSVHATNLVDRFDPAGVSWRGYMENQNVTAGCENGDSNGYEIEHNPFVAFANIDNNQTRCANIVNANPAPNSTCIITDCALINDLNSSSAPNFMWLTPNDCNNMHSANPPSSCTNGCNVDESPACIEDGDYYLQTLVPNILTSNTFQQTRSALFITFDEGNSYCPIKNNSEDCMYAVWIGPLANNGYSSSILYNHYSLTKTIETNWNLPTMTTNDANATSMTEFFHSHQSDYSITSSPTLLVSPPGLNTTSTITVASLNSYTGTVNLTATLIPPASTASNSGGGSHPLIMSPPSSSTSLPVAPSSRSIPISGSGQYTLTVQVPGNSQPANSRIIITATDGKISHTIGMILSVVNFAVQSPTSSVSVTGGTNTMIALQLLSYNYFRGIIILTASVNPSGPTASLNPSSVQLTPLGSSTVLTILVPSGTNPGTYSLTVHGIFGSFSHSLGISIFVTSGPTTVLVNLINSNPIVASLFSLASLLVLIPIVALTRFHGKGPRANYSWIKARPKGEIHANVVGPFWTVQHLPNGLLD